MKFFVIIALLAISTFALEVPPQLHSLSRMKVHKQLKDAVAVGLSADATASISTTFFNHVLADVDAYINSIGTSIVIPGQDEKHYGFDPIHFSQFAVGSIAVSTAAPNQVVVDISNVQITVPDTNFHVKESIIHCKGHFSVVVEGGNFRVTLDMGNAGNGHITTVATVATSYAELKVSHRFDEFLCRIGQDLIQLFIGNIDSLIDKVIKNDLPAKLGPAMTKSFDDLFAKIPLYFTGTPVVVNQGISITVDLLANVANFPHATVTERLNKLNDFNHDLTVSVPQASLNNILLAAQGQGKLQYDIRLKETTKILKDLIPTAYNACPDCPLDLDFNLLKAPSVTLNNNDVDATANFIDVSFRGFNASTNTIVPLFVININTTVGVNNLTIRTQGQSISNLYFQLAVTNLQIALKSSSIGPLPILPTIADLLEYVITSLAVPAFNANFQGFNFPALFSNVVVTALQGVFQFETDLLLPPIQAGQ